jgi:F0F1-type ATP synthase membrane subunit b/b'
MDINQIIDALEREFANSKNFLWSKKTLVNMDKCASLIAEIRANLPQAIQEASYVLSKKEQILNNAQAEAKHIVAEAEYRAEQLVSSSEIKKRSERIADETLQRANRKCDQLFAVTKENVDKLLKSVELYLDQNLDVVKRNRDELDMAINNLKASDSPLPKDED